MKREVPRTVQSFLAPYQSNIDNHEMEIIVLENGSTEPIDKSIIKSWPDNVNYISLKDPHVSPAYALNYGVEVAKGDFVCLVIDGARLVTPGVLGLSRDIFKVDKRAVVATVGFHLGLRVQQENVEHGYNQNVEDKLLEKINWPNQPYRLFEICSLGGSAGKAWFGPVAESNVILMHRKVYNDIGGYDQNFDLPGGGLVNLDFYRRLVTSQKLSHYMLFGEGSFHQFHGGVTTSRSVGKVSVTDKSKTTWDIYNEQYRDIRGEFFCVYQSNPILYGRMQHGLESKITEIMDKLKN